MYVSRCLLHVQLATLGRWTARKAKVFRLSRDEDKNHEFALVPCGLMLGRNLYLRTKRLPRSREAHNGICSTVHMYNRGVSAVLSTIPLHMPRTDRQSILLLAYRNSLERDRHRDVGNC